MTFCPKQIDFRNKTKLLLKEKFVKKKKRQITTIAMFDTLARNLYIIVEPRMIEHLVDRRSLLDVTVEHLLDQVYGI